MRKLQVSPQSCKTLYAILTALALSVLAAPLFAESELPRVAVLPFSNETGNESYDTVCGSASRTLELTLRSLGNYRVVPVPRSALASSGNSVRKLARAQDVDTVLYGTMKLDDRGLIVASVSIFDWEKDPSKVDSEPVKLLDIFGAVDELVVSALDSMTGTHIGFGSLEFKNSGEKGVYDVSIDGIDVGPGIETISKWKAGPHKVVVSQKRMLGEWKLYEKEVNVAENGSLAIAFAVPRLLDGERKKIEGLEASIDAGWKDENAVAATERSILDYVDLWKDTSYCESLATYVEKARKLQSDWEAQKLTFSKKVIQVVEVKTAPPEQPAKATGPVEPGLVAWYKFDETKGAIAHDSSGNGQDAKLRGRAMWASGAHDNAISLKSGYVELPSELLDAVHDFTVATWVKVDEERTWARLFDFGAGTTDYIFMSPNGKLDNKSGFSRLAARSGNEREQTLDASSIDYSYWRFVAATLSNGTATLYIDGKSVGTSTHIKVAPDALGGIAMNYIGKSQYAADPYLAGEVDDFKIYDHALSPSEIAAIITPADQKFMALQQERARIASTYKTRSRLIGLGALTSSVAVIGAACGVASYFLGKAAYEEYTAAKDSASADKYREKCNNYSNFLTIGIGMTGGGILLSPIFFLAAPKKSSIDKALASLDEQIEELRK